jgi:hypothetical protein
MVRPPSKAAAGATGAAAGGGISGSGSTPLPSAAQGGGIPAGEIPGNKRWLSPLSPPYRKLIVDETALLTTGQLPDCSQQLAAFSAAAARDEVHSTTKMQVLHKLGRIGSERYTPEDVMMYKLAIPRKDVDANDPIKLSVPSHLKSMKRDLIKLQVCLKGGGSMELAEEPGWLHNLYVMSSDTFGFVPSSIRSMWDQDSESNIIDGRIVGTCTYAMHCTLTLHLAFYICHGQQHMTH